MKIEEVDISTIQKPPTFEDIDISSIPGLGTRFYEGVKDVVNNVVGSIEGLSMFYQEVDKQNVKELGPEGYADLKNSFADIGFYSPDPEKLKETEEWAQKTYGSGWLKPVNLPKREGIKGYIDSVTQIAPQVLAQIGVTVGAGGAGGGVFMGSQIFGGKYKRLTQKGVDPMVAFKASVTDAALQAPLEQIGIGKALKFWKPALSKAFVFKAMLEAGGTEFLTEFLQQYPDAATEIWAEAQQKGQSDQETVDIFLNRFSEITKEGLYQGAVAAPFGAVIGGGGAAVNKVAPEETSTIETQEEAPAVEIEEVSIDELGGVEIDESSPESPVVRDVEEQLAESVDFVKGEPVPPIGLSTKQVGYVSGDITESSISFDDPQIEQRFKAAHGIQQEKVLDKVKGYATTFKNRFSRAFEHLPNVPEYAQIKQLLSKIPKNRAIAIDRTLRAVQGMTAKLSPNEYNLLERKIILDDLMHESSQGRSLPFGFTSDVLQSEHAKLTSISDNNANVRESLAARQQFMDSLRNEYQTVMSQIGFNPEFNNPNYFRHQVLMYADAKGRVSQKGVKTPSNRSFLRKRQGSSLDINTNYIQAESEVIAQMLHDIETAKIIRYVMENFDIADRVKEDQRQNGLDGRTIRKDFVPDGYRLWQPDKGNVFYMADSIPTRIADTLMMGKLDSYELTADEISQVMAIAGRKMQLVIPEELAKTLDQPFPKHSENLIAKADREAIKLWKKWQLGSPRRFVKYNTRNLWGDAEAVFIGNPRAFKKLDKASRDLYQVFYNDGAMSPEMRQWFQLGGFESNLQFQEMGDIHKLKIFENLQKKEGKKFSDVAKVPWRGYWKHSRLATDFRESILRYAAFIDYLEQLEINNGVPNNYGASIPAEVNALESNANKAYKLSNDLLGAYDEITVFGRALREHVFPFWSFQEINMKRYWRFWKNAVNDGTTMEMVGRKVAAKGLNPMTYIRIGKLLVAVMALDTATHLFNTMVFPDEEDDLPESVRSKSHIILGRNEEGEVRYFSRLGLLSDILDWFNLEDYRLTLRELLTGKTNVKEVITEMSKGPVDKVFQGSRPFLKLIGELAFRRSSFPSVFEPRAIRDRGYHLAKSFGLENEYVWLMRLPSEGYQSTMSDFFTYSVDPLQSKYSNILDKKNRFMKRINKGQGDGFFVSPKGNALYNYSLAKKLGDKDAEERFLNQYIKYTTNEGIREKKLTLKEIQTRLNQSIKRAEPLYGLNDTERAVFLSQLDEKEKKDLAAAYHFWLEVMDGKTVIGRKP